MYNLILSGHFNSIALMVYLLKTCIVPIHLEKYTSIYVNTCTSQTHTEILVNMSIQKHKHTVHPHRNALPSSSTYTQSIHQLHTYTHIIAHSNQENVFMAQTSTNYFPVFFHSLYFYAFIHHLNQCPNCCYCLA